MITLTVGPLSAEAVPSKLMATATGLVIGVGEIFGGGIAPVIAGYVAHHFGIRDVPYLGVGGFIVGIFVSSCLEGDGAGRTGAGSVRQAGGNQDEAERFVSRVGRGVTRKGRSNSAIGRLCDR